MDLVLNNLQKLIFHKTQPPIHWFWERPAPDSRLVPKLFLFSIMSCAISIPELVLLYDSPPLHRYCRQIQNNNKIDKLTSANCPQHQPKIWPRDP